MLTRHGLRYPFQDEVQQITNLREKLLTLPDGLNYRNRLTWGSNYTLEQAETLTRSGEIEQFKLDARIGLRYSALLENSVRQLNVVSSTRKRNRQSSTSFIKCVKNSAVIFGGCKITLTDRLGNYEDCPNYKELLRDDREFKRYQQTAEFLSVKERLRGQLGLETISPGRI